MNRSIFKGNLTFQKKLKTDGAKVEVFCGVVHEWLWFWWIKL